MALIPGTRLGPYEITAQIGVGGMGEVYQATDTNLKRSVAIKVLPTSVAGDAERLARFQREAEVLAALNHPNIAAIYGLEKSDGTIALVMELVEGPTLADRIAQGAIPVDEALPIAKQIAEALEAAHEQGIIHRDLKPANIKVRPDGTVKVLDFGLAKAMEPVGVMSPSVSQSPTITTPAMTEAGMILGTAAYMSPEQARGAVVDKRSDLWAFGVVLWEMLLGAGLFEGGTVSDTLASVLKTEPPWNALAPSTPVAIRRLLRRCLEKDRRRRLDSAAAARLEIEEATTSPMAVTDSPAQISAPRGRVAWIAARAVVVVVIAALAIPTLRHLREVPPPETRVDIVTPASTDLASFALSPDGRQLVFVASGDESSRLWLRSLDSPTAEPLVGTEGALRPFWAPDSRSIGFFAGNALKRLDLGGGAPQNLAPVTGGAGGTWNDDGVIVFAPGVTGPLLRVPATGGTTAAVTTLGPHQSGHLAPSFLPDGRRLLFTVLGSTDTSGIYLGDLDGSAPASRLAPDLSRAAYAPAGWLLWARAGALVSQRLDLGRAALGGEVITLADGIVVDRSVLHAFSMATTGLVAYRAETGSRQHLAWFDRTGTQLGTLGEPGSFLSNPRVSPDGRRVAVSRTVQGNTDIWLLDGARASRFTFDPAADGRPVWAPDGTRIAFMSRRALRADLYEKRANGAGAEERLVASDQGKLPSSWSADGRFVLYHSEDPESAGDLWVVPTLGDRMPSLVLKSPFREAYGAFSPDDRWVAYQSNESGRMEIYVRPFVPPGAEGTGAAGGQWQVSTEGGISPVWRPDGAELYYINPDGALMAAPATVVGSSLEAGEPVVLFPTRIDGGGVDNARGPQYDVGPDGRFLINTVLDEATAPITLILNWNPEAK